MSNNVAQNLKNWDTPLIYITNLEGDFEQNLVLDRFKMLAICQVVNKPIFVEWPTTTWEVCFFIEHQHTFYRCFF